MEKLEIPMEAAMPCKLRTTKRPNNLPNMWRETDDETKGSNNVQKTKHACIVEAHESTRKLSEEIDQEQKGRLIWTHKGEQSPFLLRWWTSLISKMRSWNRCCRKSNGCHCKITEWCRTSTRRSIRLHSSKNGGRSKIPESECPDIWIRLPRPEWPMSRSNIEDPVVHLEWNLHGHPLAGLLLGKTMLRKFFWDWDWEKSTESTIILIGIRGWYQNGWKKAEN